MCSGLSNPPQLVPVTRITLCQPGVERQKWRKRNRIQRFFPGIQLNFVLSNLIKFTTRSLRMKTGKRARRRQRAQKSMETGIPLSDTLQSPVKRPKPDSEEEDQEVLFAPKRPETKVMPSSGCKITGMVKTLDSAIATVSQDTVRIHQAYQQLCADNIVRDKALADQSAMVREYGTPPAMAQPYGPPTPAGRPRPPIQADVLDRDGNLRAADIGITWVDKKHSCMVSG